MTPRSPARRALTRLRWRLTVAYTLITALGLAVLSFVALRTDADSRRDAVYSTMREQAAVARSLIYYDGGRIQFDGLADDDATNGDTRVVVLVRGPNGALTPAFTGGRARFAISAARLGPVARRALADDDTVDATGHDDAGRTRYLVALPFYRDGDGTASSDTAAGVVAVAATPADGSTGHRELLGALVLGGLALTAVGAATGHLLSRRSVRPALEAQERHERLLADTAHELRTPVTVIRAALDLAETAPRASAEHLPRIRAAGDRLADVVENVLTRARLQAGAQAPRPEPLRLDQLVEAVCGELPDGDHRVTLDLEPAVVNADAALVRTAVRNLLDNAVRHGSTTPGRDDADITVTVRGAAVSVADRGRGVPPEEAEGVFARFRTSGGNGGGSGIGLSLVRWVADAHGGDVGVLPRPGGGSVFTLTLESPQRPGAGRGRSRRGRRSAVR